MTPRTREAWLEVGRYVIHSQKDRPFTTQAGKKIYSHVQTLPKIPPTPAQGPETIWEEQLDFHDYGGY